MRTSLLTRITSASEGRTVPLDEDQGGPITDETARVVMANAHRTARALVRTTSTLTPADADDIAVTGATLALLRVADAITSGTAHDAALMAREGARVAFLDARGDALTSCEAVSALDWTGDDGDTRAALTAQVRAADADWSWSRRDALALALDETDAGPTVRTLLSWSPCPGRGCTYRACQGEDKGARHYVLPGDDGRAWRGEDGGPSVVPALDALALPSSGRRRAASVALLADALGTVALVTREHQQGWATPDRAARWSDRAARWSDDARRACQHPGGEGLATGGDRFTGTASPVIVTRPVAGPVPVGGDPLGTLTYAIVPGDKGRTLVLVETDEDRARILATPDRAARPVTDRASDRAALALAPLAGVKPESSRKSKRGGGVGGPTLPSGWQAGWGERRA